jgi:hypothetical protein
MDPETKTIQRDSLRDLIDASRAPNEKHHAHVVKRAQVRRDVRTVREPSALRGLFIVLLLALGIRSLVVWFF